MPRLAGQIDRHKNEAILDAAVEVFAERGLAASMEEIARRANVSKQTIYNHYGSKAELISAIAERRVHEITAPLDAAGAAEHPQAALAEFARILVGALLLPRAAAFFRMAILSATGAPEIARAWYDAGPRASRRRLADFLQLETQAGRLCCPDSLEAAEFFAGMVIGSFQTAAMLGVETSLTPERIDRIAQEAAARFMRAYAP